MRKAEVEIGNHCLTASAALRVKPRTRCEDAIPKTRRDSQMRIRLVDLILVALALLAISPDMQAQTSAKLGPGAASAIPDLSGIWEPHRPIPVTPETALCGIRVVC